MNVRFTRPVWILGAATAALTMSIGLRASTSVDRQMTQAPPSTSAGDSQDDQKLASLGKETAERICIICHPWENITRIRRTQKEWHDTVVNMAERGAPGTEPEFAIVTKYLTRLYGVVSVNTAPASEIAAVLGLSAKDAEAIVDYRKTHGKFTDTASLTKVNGIDRRKLEQQSEALRFD